MKQSYKILCMSVFLSPIYFNVLERNLAVNTPLNTKIGNACLPPILSLCTDKIKSLKVKSENEHLKKEI